MAPVDPNSDPAEPKPAPPPGIGKVHDVPKDAPLDEEPTHGEPAGDEPRPAQGQTAAGRGTPGDNYGATAADRPRPAREARNPHGQGLDRR